MHIHSSMFTELNLHKLYILISKDNNIYIYYIEKLLKNNFYFKIIQKMNKILDVVEDIKQNITDNQYKIIMDSLMEMPAGSRCTW